MKIEAHYTNKTVSLSAETAAEVFQLNHVVQEMRACGIEVKHWRNEQGEGFSIFCAGGNQK